MTHKNICEALECTVYFADPYCSGQKGAIENANKILREYFPRKTKEEIRLFNSQNCVLRKD